MPYYRVLLEASEIRVRDLSGGPPIIGFFATRVVHADSLQEAKKKATDMVLADWTTGEYAALNIGNRPVVKVDGVYASNWSKHFVFKNKGHAFFTEDGSAEQAIAADRGERRRSR